MDRPRLLFLAQTLPYPPHGGAKIRTYHTLRILSSLYQVDALCFYRARTLPDNLGVDGALEGLRDFGPIEGFPIPQEGRPSRWVYDHFRSVGSRTSYVRFLYDSQPFRQSLQRRLENAEYDVIHFDSLDLVRYLEDIEHPRITCTHHNIESQLLSNRAAQERSRVRAGYLRLQSRWTRRMEREWAPRVNLNIVVSEKDKERLEEIAPEARIEVIRNGVDTEFFRPPDRLSGEGLVFVGGTTWYPNKDALEYYVSDIAPRIREVRGPTPVTWVGQLNPGEREEFDGSRGLRLTGYVDDIRPYVHDALCYIVPLRVGGGTRLKIVDAWAMGMPVVSTTRGAEGLKAEHGRNILLADSPEEFANAVDRVLNDPELRSRLGRKGRQTAEDHYSWNVLSGTFENLYRTL